VARSDPDSGVDHRVTAFDRGGSLSEHDRQGLFDRHQPSRVLGLRFFVCEGCETVHASPDEPPGCRDCGVGTFREITRRLQADTYFLPPAE
jgi:hypothetical protein